MNIRFRKLILGAFFTGLTVVGAYIRLPFPLVPMTLQVMMILLTGLLLPPKTASFAQGAYVLLGLAGVPVFSGGGGISYVLAPTFGYLAAAVPAAWAVAVLSENRKPSLRRYVAAACAGICVMYLLGVTVLYLNLNFIAEKTTSFTAALKIGVLPFVLPDFLKACAASVLAFRVRKVFPGRLMQ